jgi:hypothetical protein
MILQRLHENIVRALLSLEDIVVRPGTAAQAFARIQ